MMLCWTRVNRASLSFPWVLYERNYHHRGTVMGSVERTLGGNAWKAHAMCGHVGFVHIGMIGSYPTLRRARWAVYRHAQKWQAHEARIRLGEPVGVVLAGEP